MTDANVAATFKACETKRGSDWSVLVTWPDQREQYLDGFQSFEEAVSWVRDKSQAWLEAQQINACPSPPRLHDHIWSRFENSTAPDRRDAISRNSQEPRETDAIDKLIDVIDTHRESSKEDRKTRGESFKDEQGPK